MRMPSKLDKILKEFSKIDQVIPLVFGEKITASDIKALMEKVIKKIDEFSDFILSISSSEADKIIHFLICRKQDAENVLQVMSLAHSLKQVEEASERLNILKASIMSSDSQDLLPEQAHLDQLAEAEAYFKACVRFAEHLRSELHVRTMAEGTYLEEMGIDVPGQFNVTQRLNIAYALAELDIHALRSTINPTARPPEAMSPTSETETDFSLEEMILSRLFTSAQKDEDLRIALGRNVAAARPLLLEHIHDILSAHPVGSIKSSSLVMLNKGVDSIPMISEYGIESIQVRLKELIRKPIMDQIKAYLSDIKRPIGIVSELIQKAYKGTPDVAVIKKISEYLKTITKHTKSLFKFVEINSAILELAGGMVLVNDLLKTFDKTIASYSTEEVGGAVTPLFELIQSKHGEIYSDLASGFNQSLNPMTIAGIDRAIKRLKNNLKSISELTSAMQVACEYSGYALDINAENEAVQKKAALAITALLSLKKICEYRDSLTSLIEVDDTLAHEAPTEEQSSLGIILGQQLLLSIDEQAKGIDGAVQVLTEAGYLDFNTAVLTQMRQIAPLRAMISGKQPVQTPDVDSEYDDAFASRDSFASTLTIATAVRHADDELNEELSSDDETLVVGGENDSALAITPDVSRIIAPVYHTDSESNSQSVAAQLGMQKLKMGLFDQPVKRVMWPLMERIPLVPTEAHDRMLISSRPHQDKAALRLIQSLLAHKDQISTALSTLRDLKTRLEAGISAEDSDSRGQILEAAKAQFQTIKEHLAEARSELEHVNHAFRDHLKLAIEKIYAEANAVMQFITERGEISVEVWSAPQSRTFSEEQSLEQRDDDGSTLGPWSISGDDRLEFDLESEGSFEDETEVDELHTESDANRQLLLTSIDQHKVEADRALTHIASLKAAVDIALPGKITEDAGWEILEAAEFHFQIMKEHHAEMRAKSISLFQDLSDPIIVTIPTMSKHAEELMQVIRANCHMKPEVVMAPEELGDEGLRSEQKDGEAELKPADESLVEEASVVPPPPETAAVSAPIGNHSAEILNPEQEAMLRAFHAEDSQEAAKALDDLFVAQAFAEAQESAANIAGLRASMDAAADDFDRDIHLDDVFGPYDPSAVQLPESTAAVDVDARAAAGSAVVPESATAAQLGIQTPKKGLFDRPVIRPVIRPLMGRIPLVPTEAHDRMLISSRPHQDKAALRLIQSLLAHKDQISTALITLRALKTRLEAGISAEDSDSRGQILEAAKAQFQTIKEHLEEARSELEHVDPAVRHQLNRAIDSIDAEAKAVIKFITERGGISVETPSRAERPVRAAAGSAVAPESATADLAGTGDEALVPVGRPSSVVLGDDDEVVLDGESLDLSESALSSVTLGASDRGFTPDAGEHLGQESDSPVDSLDSPRHTVAPSKGRATHRMQSGGISYVAYFTDEVVKKGQASKTIQPAQQTQAQNIEIRSAGNEIIDRFKGVILEEGDVIRSTGTFKVQGKQDVHGILEQSRDNVIKDLTTDKLSDEQQSIMAVKQAKMLLMNYKSSQGPILIFGSDPKQADRVYAALLLLTDKQPVEIRSFVPGHAEPKSLFFISSASTNSWFIKSKLHKNAIDMAGREKTQSYVKASLEGFKAQRELNLDPEQIEYIDDATGQLIKEELTAAVPVVGISPIGAATSEMPDPVQQRPTMAV